MNYTLNDIIQNEFDRSIAVAVALAALGSLRHSEVDAMNCKNFYHNELMNVSPNTMEYGGYDKEYYEQHEELMFVDSAIMTIHCKDTLQLPKGGIVRVCAIPKALREIVDYAMEQRRQVYALIDKEITGDEQLYMPMTYLFSGKKFNAQKLGRRWTEYQRRRNKRMEEAGLEPIPEVRFHDLRHTHSNLTKMEVPSWQISCNMGHKLSKDDECVTKTVYWNDRQKSQLDEVFETGIIKEVKERNRYQISNLKNLTALFYQFDIDEIKRYKSQLEKQEVAE